MRLMDTTDGQSYGLPELHTEWLALRSEDPENHAGSFKTELFEILMATVNGRNDVDVIGPTTPELCRLIDRLRRCA